MTVVEAIERVSRWLDKGTQHEASQLGYIEGWFTKDDEQAFLMAIRSLEAWDKVREEIERIGGYEEKTVYKCPPPSYIRGLEKSLEIIDKHLAEVMK